MGLPIVVIEGWPDDQVAIVGPKLAEAIRRALGHAAKIAADEARSAADKGK